MVCDEVVDSVRVGPGGGFGITLDMRRPDEATTILGLAGSSSSEWRGYEDVVVKTTSIGVMGECIGCEDLGRLD